VLAAGQQALARRFASKENTKFAEVPHSVHDGIPVIDGTLAWVGCELDQLVPAGDHTIGIGAVHAAELWNPATERWTTLAANSVIRMYHSTTLLLPDGRLLHAGSGDGASAANELNAELFSPPYLFKGARPTISGAPASVGYNQSFEITSPQAASIAQVTLLRLGSVTHAFDLNQRFNRLSFTRTPNGVSARAPANGNLAPPGHYMLFLVNGDGVPSVARIVQLQ